MDSPTTTGAAAASSGGARRGAAGFGLVLGAVATTAMLAGASAPSPFYPLLEERLHLGAVGVTAAFAIYALALLVALLTVGSISDHLGRRPVIATGFVLLAAGLATIWLADNAQMLFAGRTLQGLATGALVATTSAIVTDLTPAGRPQRAALINSVSPLVGLALGALLAGAWLQAAPAIAAEATFLPIIVVYLLVAVVIWAVPETSPRRPGWRASLRPRAAVPPVARGLFGISVPIMLAGWATGGLFLSLGPTIVHAELHVDGQLGPALVIGVLPAAGAIAAFLMRHRPSAVAAVYGAAALAVGTVVMLGALVLGSLPIYVVAVAIAGTGFGTAFMGTVASLLPFAAVHERAELFASIYIVSYLSFGVPAVIAGILAATIGLHATVLGYGAVVAVAAGVAAVTRARWRSSALAG